LFDETPDVLPDIPLEVVPDASVNAESNNIYLHIAPDVLPDVPPDDTHVDIVPETVPDVPWVDSPIIGDSVYDVPFNVLSDVKPDIAIELPPGDDIPADIVPKTVPDVPPDDIPADTAPETVPVVSPDIVYDVITDVIPDASTSASAGVTHDAPPVELPPEPPAHKTIALVINGRDIDMQYKSTAPLLVDVLNCIDFDGVDRSGRLMLKKNGAPAKLMDPIEAGDSVVIEWDNNNPL